MNIDITVRHGLLVISTAHNTYGISLVALLVPVFVLMFIIAAAIAIYQKLHK